jgi:hypothetical protein
MGAQGGGFFALTLSSQTELDSILDGELALRPDYLWISGDRSKGLGKELLRAAIQRGHAAGVPSLVWVPDAIQGNLALDAGADALCGDQFGEGDRALFQRLARERRYWAQSAVELDCVEPGGTEGFLEDPLAKVLVDPRVLSSFLDPGTYGPDMHQYWSMVVAHQGAIRRTLALAGAEGVPLLTTSLAGWMPWSFQGEGPHRCLIQLGRQGVPVWQALAAATSGPADFVHETSGFISGAPADLVALTKDPVQDLRNVESVDEVCIGGIWPRRSTLLPDLWRHHY